jgi:hypothetical protein
MKPTHSDPGQRRGSGCDKATMHPPSQRWEHSPNPTMLTTKQKQYGLPEPTCQCKCGETLPMQETMPLTLVAVMLWWLGWEPWEGPPESAAPGGPTHGGREQPNREEDAPTSVHQQQKNAMQPKYRQEPPAPSNNKDSSEPFSAHYCPSHCCPCSSGWSSGDRLGPLAVYLTLPPAVHASCRVVLMSCRCHLSPMAPAGFAG